MDKSGGIGSKVLFGIGIGRKRDDGRGTPVKIVITNDDLGLIFRNSFFLVAPFSSNFDSSLHSFSTCIHTKYLIKTKVFGNVLHILSQFIVVESSGG